MRKGFILLFVSIAMSSYAQHKDNQYFEINKNLSIFNNILKELNAYYVDTIHYEHIITTAIDQTLNSLDPYTKYIPESKNDELKLMTTGEYAGIGAIIMQKGKEIIISEPYEGMPALKNGLKAGDIILSVNGKSTKDKSTSQVSEMLKGKQGTEIKIKIKRPYEKHPIIKSFLRENIQFDPIVYATQLGQGVGYVMLSDFTDKAASSFKTNVQSLIDQHDIQSLIVDLRDNGGGLVNEAVKILGYFLPKGTTIVTTKGRNNNVEYEYKTPTEPIFGTMRLAILVNHNSASASEIMAGAIQDLDRGTIIGERTFGKGLVQSIRPVGYGGYVKITTSKYYTPSGRCLQAIDYTHRGENGRAKTIPDSLTHTFKTEKGRRVKDGGGVMPDSLTTDSNKINISYHLFQQNTYFDYATRYAHQHKSIPLPKDFKLTEKEINDFFDYVLNEQKFTYTTQTEKYVEQVEKIAKMEGIDTLLRSEIKVLKNRLTPNIGQELEENRYEIIRFLTMEIIQRYYHQKGQVAYMLLEDKDIKIAISTLQHIQDSL